MSDEGLPLEQFDTLFVDTATAVGAAQAALDLRHVNPGQLAYALSDATVETEFGVSEEHVAFWGSRRKFDLSEALQFSVIAVPDRPPCPVSSTFPASVAVRRPAYLVSPETRRNIADAIISDLESGEIECRVPGMSDIPRDDLKTESDAIQGAFNDDESVGVVALRLAQPDEAYLVVRIGGGRDGLYVFERGASGSKTTVYSVLAFEGSDRQLYYEPLYRAVQSLRASALGAESAASSLPSREGFIATQPFADLIWGAQQKARYALCSRPPSDTHFELRDVEATLRYSVHPPHGADEDAVRVRAQLRMAFSEDLLRYAVVNPEFVLAPEGRASVLALLRENADHIDVPQDYRKAVRASTAPAAAIALLAYQGKRPRHQFLLVWPAPAGGDFAFSFRYEGRDFEKTQVLIPLDDRLRGARPDTPIPYESYEPADGVTGFHDFFHAIRVWDLASAGELKP